MFKLLSIAVFSYILFRLFKPKALNEANQRQQVDQNDEGEFVDYEEIND